MSSLRAKVIVGFYAFAVLIISLAALAYADLRYLEQRIARTDVVVDFFNGTLEMRRFEKNYFLYGNDVDYRAAHRYAERVLGLVSHRKDVFAQAAHTDDLRALATQLRAFRARLKEYAALPADAPERVAMEARIRAHGRAISNLAQHIRRQEQASQRQAIAHSRTILVYGVVALSIIGLLIGHVLSRLIVRPLRKLEQAMLPIAQGRFDRLTLRSKDREIVSLTHAFNRMLQGHDLHMKHLIQSERLASLGILVSGVAHELNNPLSNISTSCQILLEAGDSAAMELRQEMLGQIESETERARVIVQSLLDFSRQRSFKKEPVALRQLIEQTLQLLKRQIPAQVSINIKVPHALSIEVDKQRMQQALLNLIKNALEAVHDDGVVTLKAEFTQLMQPQPLPTVYLHNAHPPECAESGSAVLISVEDNGAGIAPEHLSKIFDPFYTSKDVGHGSGLGLFVTQEIVREHDGCIGVESEQGKGTRFILKLPHKATA